VQKYPLESFSLVLTPRYLTSRYVCIYNLERRPSLRVVQNPAKIEVERGVVASSDVVQWARTNPDSGRDAVCRILWVVLCFRIYILVLFCRWFQNCPQNYWLQVISGSPAREIIPRMNTVGTNRHSTTHTFLSTRKHFHPWPKHWTCTLEYFPAKATAFKPSNQQTRAE